MHRLLLLTNLFALTAATETSPKPTADPLRRNIIVMLEAADQTGESSCAAGIIFSQTPTRTLILTVHHFVKQASEKLDASSLHYTAEFNFRRGEPVEARRLARFEDEGLDYAVFSIDGKLAPVLPDRSILNALGSLKSPSGGYHEVTEVGHANCRPWEHEAVPQHVLEATSYVIRFESRFVVGGASGGAVMTDDGNLVGMVVSADGFGASARPIGPILEEVERRGLEVALTESPEAVAETAAASIVPPPAALSVSPAAAPRVGKVTMPAVMSLVRRRTSPTVAGKSIPSSPSPVFVQLVPEDSRFTANVTTESVAYVSAGYNSHVRLNIRIQAPPGQKVAILSGASNDGNFMDDWVLSTSAGECHAAKSTAGRMTLVRSRIERDAATPTLVTDRGLTFVADFNDCKFAAQPGTPASFRLRLLQKKSDGWVWGYFRGNGLRLAEGS